MKKAYLNWSSGKDAALALYQILQAKEYSIDKILTTVNPELNRVSMHGVRNELVIRQAENLQIPLQLVKVPSNASMDSYNIKMQQATDELLAEGYTHSIFGDIFLEDLRKYREEQLSKVGIKAVFPLWKRDTSKLMRTFLDLNFKAIVICTNLKYLDKSFCGRLIDDQFLKDLPEGVDPCGEYGEFHTFVFDGPIFKNPIRFEIGEQVSKSYTPSKNGDTCFSKADNASWDTKFWYCDLVPKN